VPGLVRLVAASGPVPVTCAISCIVSLLPISVAGSALFHPCVRSLYLFASIPSSASTRPPHHRTLSLSFFVFSSTGKTFTGGFQRRVAVLYFLVAVHSFHIYDLIQKKNPSYFFSSFFPRAFLPVSFTRVMLQFTKCCCAGAGMGGCTNLGKATRA
jgi:hypothetical protein